MCVLCLSKWEVKGEVEIIETIAEYRMEMNHDGSFMKFNILVLQTLRYKYICSHFTLACFPAFL